GTFAPDAAYRWMGSAAMDRLGNIAIGYSKSSSSVYPSIAITSRTPGMPLGTMGTETILQAGNGAQTTYPRWGDYTSLRIDLSDSGSPQRTSASFTPNPVTATANSTLKITVNRNAATGTYPLTITGNNGSASHPTSLSLIVQ